MGSVGGSINNGERRVTVLWTSQFDKELIIWFVVRHVDLEMWVVFVSFRVITTTARTGSFPLASDLGKCSENTGDIRVHCVSNFTLDKFSETNPIRYDT